MYCIIPMASLYTKYYLTHVCPTGTICCGSKIYANEERIIGYLRQYVGNLNTEGLRNFLRFVTGSVVCSTLKIHHTCQPSRFSRDYTGIYTSLPVSREFTSLSRFSSPSILSPQVWCFQLVALKYCLKRA